MEHVCRYCGENPDLSVACCQFEEAERMIVAIDEAHEDQAFYAQFDKAADNALMAIIRNPVE